MLSSAAIPFPAVRCQKIGNIYPSYCPGFLQFTPVTYFCKHPGIYCVAALGQPELSAEFSETQPGLYHAVRIQ